jgi:prolyl oligopeptidase
MSPGKKDSPPGSRITYPKTDQFKTVDNYHGVEVVDNYQWLEKVDDPKVQAWVAAQEALTRSYLDTIPQRSRILERLTHLWHFDYQSAPLRVINGERVFFWRRSKDQQKRILITKEDDCATEVVLVDPNQWDKGEELGYVIPSTNGRYVAFGKAFGGNENWSVHIMETETGKILSDTIRGWNHDGVSWFSDDSGFYYSCNPCKGEVPEDEESFWHTVYLHKLGTKADQDVKVFGDDDIKEYYHYAKVSECGRYTILSKNQIHLKNELYFKEAHENQVRPMATGFDGYYTVLVVEGKLLIKTDADAPKGKVYITDIDKIERRNWVDFIPENNDILQSLTAVGGHVYATYLHNAYNIVKIFSLDGEFIREMPLPGKGSVVTLRDDGEYDSIIGTWSHPEVWVNFVAYTSPRAIYKYDIETNGLELYYKPNIDFNSSDYITEQAWYPSKDGTRVSMFLVHRKGLLQDKTHSVRLVGYGAFNFSVTPEFTVQNAVWLEMGGITAYANIRGGGEYGREWHEKGIREKKHNTFDDFIYAAEWLIEKGYTTTDKLGVHGNSSGGFMVSAVTNQRPDLFKAVVSRVGLYDMLRRHLFGGGAFFNMEFGCSENKEEFDWIYNYSPYHNVKEGLNYPAYLIITGLNDPRCHSSHAFKMAARLQAASSSNRPVLLLPLRGAGHTGAVTKIDLIKESADILAFNVSQLGLR